MLLREIEVPSAAAVAVVDPGVLDSHMTGQQSADTFLWDLDWWLTTTLANRESDAAESAPDFVTIKHGRFGGGKTRQWKDYSSRF